MARNRIRALMAYPVSGARCVTGYGRKVGGARQLAGRRQVCRHLDLARVDDVAGWAPCRCLNCDGRRRGAVRRQTALGLSNTAIPERVGASSISLSRVTPRRLLYQCQIVDP
jgi:hypothetical protein